MKTYITRVYFAYKDKDAIKELKKLLSIYKDSKIYLNNKEIKIHEL